MEESKSMRVEVTSRETIKPSSPSPNPDQPGTFKLSLLDQFTPQIYISVLLFYKATTCDGSRGKEINERSQRLKSSLSETLTRFYPFAGSLKDPLTISCNDEGVDYSEAHVLKCSLSHVLEKPNPNQLSLLVPNESPDSETWPLLLVQVSFFDCGGMALGMKFHHRVADAATLATFTNAWAISALGNINYSVIPDFSASTLFPPTDSIPPFSPEIQPSQINIPTTIRTGRFVFGPYELAALQAEATGTNNPRPTRFEAVASLMWKNVVQSKRESRSEVKPPSVLIWAVNLRPKLQPPLLEHCFGNVVGHPVHEGEVDGDDLRSLAGHLRRGMINMCNDYVQMLKGNASVQGIFEIQMNIRNKFKRTIGSTAELCIMTSWCKLPFYEADFGWGKPLWVANGGFLRAPNVIMFMDTRDGLGIEAWVCLTEAEMSAFESNQELLKYASFNPSSL